MLTFASLLCYFSILIATDSAEYSCSVGFKSDSKRESDKNLIAGYNDVLGPIINLTYFDSSLLLSADKLYPGALRHPGGTVANYWNFSNASYVSPCSTINYNYCSWEERIDKLPKQTFSPSNFYHGIGKNKTIVYDLNLLTFNGDEMNNQIDILTQQIGAENIKYLELGNEYYISKNYNWSLPNSSYYMEKAKPLIEKIRKDIPDAKIAAVSQRCLGNHANVWNEGIKKYISLVDAVTIHDYSCNEIDTLSFTQQLSYVSVYGHSVIPQYIEYVQTYFGKNIKIWMTEYNDGIKTYKTNATFQYSAIHAMFVLSYIIESICDYDTETVQLLMLNFYSEQNGTSWGPTQSASFNPAQANDNKNAQFDVVGQVLAHLAYIGLIKNDEMHCLDIKGDNNLQCPILDLEVVNKKNLSCVYGSGFSNSSDVNSFGFVLTNSCDFVINIDYDISSIAPNLNNNVSLNMWEYSAQQYGGNHAKFVDCGDENVWDDQCSAVKAITKKKINVNTNTNMISIAVQPLSFILAST